jgi:spore maturation protein CgeB
VIYDKENKFSRDLVKGLRNMNALVYPITGSKYQVKGVPDLYVCHSKYIGWLELKVKEHKCESDQKYHIRELRKRGANAFVVRPPNRVEDEHGELLAMYVDNSIPDLLDVLKALS